MDDLRRFLVDYDLAMLRALARNRGIALITNVHTEAVEQLALALRDPVSVRTALARLSPEARRALDTLLAAGGRMRAPQFARAFGQVRPMGPGRLEREEPWRQPASSAEELWYAGLIYRAFAQHDGGPGEFVFVPDDLRSLLPEPHQPEARFRVEPVPPPEGAPATAGDEGHSPLVLDLFAYLVHVQTHDARPGRPLPGLAGADQDRLDLVRHLAAQLGLVVQEEGLLRLVAAPVKRWLVASPARQLAALQEAWRDDSAWIDLCRVPGLACDEATPWLHRYDPVAARHALLSLLARGPAGDWWSVDAFVDAVRQVHPDFQRPDGDYDSWYIRDAESGDYLSSFQSWDAVEGALVRDVLARVLSWLDVVQAAPGADGSVARLTAAGRRFLELAPAAPEAAPSPSLTIRPDMLVEVPPPANLYTCFQLERFADAVGRRAAGPGRATGAEPWRYRLTVGGLGRALGRGVRVEQVLAFLRQASDDGLPVNVAGQLQLWAGRYGQVELEEMALLTVRSERVLKELSVLPETRPLIGRILSPTTALIRKAHLPRLRKVLRELGFLPFDQHEPDQL
jgi:hypothetical protein